MILSPQIAAVDVSPRPVPRLDDDAWTDASQGSEYTLRLPVKVVPVPALNGAPGRVPENLESHVYLKRRIVEHPSQYDFDEGPDNAELQPANIASERDDVPSEDNWETLSAAMSDAVPDGEADWAAHQDRLLAARRLPGQLAVSTFDSASTRSTLCRDR